MVATVNGLAVARASRLFATRRSDRAWPPPALSASRASLECLTFVYNFMSAAGNLESDCILDTWLRGRKWLTCTNDLHIDSSVRRNWKALQVRPRLKTSSKDMFSAMFESTSYGKEIRPNIRPFRGNRIWFFWIDKQKLIISLKIMSRAENIE